MLLIVISKSTPATFNHHRTTIEPDHRLQPYDIHNIQPASFSSPWSQVFSTPNLRSRALDEHETNVRRSHSAASTGLPKLSLTSPLRLPNLTVDDKDGLPWSEVMSESLRLSNFPTPPPPQRHHPNASETQRDITASITNMSALRNVKTDAVSSITCHSNDATAINPAHQVAIRVQRPTSVTTPRTSTSMRGATVENVTIREAGQHEDTKEEVEVDEQRRSVHLQSMRISHHLRSASLLSWDQLAAAPDLPNSLRSCEERNLFGNSQSSRAAKLHHRLERRTSSAEFTSCKVPSRWGKVVHDRDLRADVASSVYSSRAQSPPDSFCGSMANLSQFSTRQHNIAATSSPDITKPRRSNSFPTDDETTPRPKARHLKVDDVPIVKNASSTQAISSPLARKNSVAETKKSKFREELSSTLPLHVTLTSSSSFIKLLSPKRRSVRSQSEANLQSASKTEGTDGSADTLLTPINRSRHQSHSLISFQAEQSALGRDNGLDRVWDQALRAHQDEKATMFLPQNRGLAAQTSPMRERSGSIAARRAQEGESLAIGGQGLNMYKIPDTLASSEQNRDLALVSPFLWSSQKAQDATKSDKTAVPNGKFEDDDDEDAGAWGRYPSHTRPERTCSAGKPDRIETRDFALQTAIKFASGEGDRHDEGLVDPLERPISPIIISRNKKKRSKSGHGQMAKSNSMTFGKTLMKNYTKMFRSQSTDFRRHGRGHRSSIASGGILEFPELELVPNLWTHADDTKSTARPLDHDGTRSSQYREVLQKDLRGYAPLQVEDSMATLRPRRNSSAPDLAELSFHDGANDSQYTHDRAHIWSMYYEKCIQGYSKDKDDYASDDLTRRIRRNTGRKNSSNHSRTVPARHSNHSRNPSQLTRMSYESGQHIWNGTEAAGEGDSVLSVRASTMDLISRFHEQELTEHDRLLRFTRAESC